jgi:hypothetical protein
LVVEPDQRGENICPQRGVKSGTVPAPIARLPALLNIEIQIVLILLDCSRRIHGMTIQPDCALAFHHATPT